MRAAECRRRKRRERRRGPSSQQIDEYPIVSRRRQRDVIGLRGAIAPANVTLDAFVETPMKLKDECIITQPALFVERAPEIRYNSAKRALR